MLFFRFHRRFNEASISTSTREASMKQGQPVKDASGLYEVERRAQHAARPGFRITELQIGPTQKVPWHYHSSVSDTFYVLAGSICIYMQDPKEKIELAPGQSFAVPPK